MLAALPLIAVLFTPIELRLVATPLVLVLTPAEFDVAAVVLLEMLVVLAVTAAALLPDVVVFAVIALSLTVTRESLSLTLVANASKFAFTSAATADDPLVKVLGIVTLEALASMLLDARTVAMLREISEFFKVKSSLTLV